MSTRAQVQDACADGEETKVREMMDEGTVTADDATEALEIAREHPLILRSLLEHGASPEAIEIRLIDNLESLKVVTEFGFDIKTQGHLILQNFAHNRNALDWLLDCGVNINETDSSRLDDGFVLAHGMSDDSLHVLNQIAAAGDVELLDHLVSRGANVHDSLALHAVSRCHKPAVSIATLSYLLDKQHMNINADTASLRDFFHDAMDSGTPLCTAIYEKNLPIVNELIARGADVNDAGKTGYKPIVKAIGESRSSGSGGFLPAIELLINAGVEALPALSYAVDVLRVEAAEICLQCGAAPGAALSKAREQNATLVGENAASATSRFHDVEEARALEQRSQDMIRLLENWPKGKPS